MMIMLYKIWFLLTGEKETFLLALKKPAAMIQTSGLQPQSQRCTELKSANSLKWTWKQIF